MVISKFEWYTLLTLEQNYMPGLPVVSFRFTDEFQERYPEIQQRWIQTLLRAKGW